ncbi:diguanylate cyclase [Thiohalocapsa sp. ML1]|uniref:diguanylate cyclase n=1 Tax=Thiohalocapsa sp. ML1 TaxID=1431688 RepID=UPI0009EBD348|nr:diguanylate cyclase [Thiohalocapsa sp. ML1]
MSAREQIKSCMALAAAWLAGVLLLLPGVATALPMDGGVSRWSPQTGVELLRDPSGTLSVEQALAADGWQPNPAGTDSLGMTADTLWVRLRLEPAPGAPAAAVLEVGYPLLDTVSLTLIPDHGPRTRYKAGDKRPFRERVLLLTNPAFPVPLDQPVTLLLRLETSGSLQFPLVLWAPEAFIGAISLRELTLGLYFGGFAVLVLMSLAAYPYVRDRLFLLYGLYLGSYVLLQLSLNGLLFRFIVPEGGAWVSRLPPLLTGVTMLMMLAFGIRFLDFWRHSRALRWAFGAFRSVAALVVMSALWLPVGVAIRLASVTGIFLLPLMLAAGVYSMRRGHLAARYFTLAWGIFLFGTSVTGLTLVGLLPSRFFTTYAMQIGSLLEVVVLGLALFERFNTLHRQKEAAVAEANGYLWQLNEELERMVAKRTRELELTNARLAHMARQDSMTGLLNHGAGLAMLAERLAADAAGGAGTAVLMLDLDHFKQINDRHGHQVGDEVLRAVAAALQAHAGAYGICSRYGGEEFLLVRRVLTMDEARQFAEGVRQAVNRLRFAQGPEQVTGSLGVAVARADTGERDTPEQLIARADEALYQAKRAGRDCVVLAGQPTLLQSVYSVAAHPQ